MVDLIICLQQPLPHQFLITSPSCKNILLTILKLLLLGNNKRILIHILLQLPPKILRILIPNISLHSSKLIRPDSFIQVKRIQHLLFNLSFGQRRIKRLQYRFDFVDFKEASFVKISRIKYACLRDREWKETLWLSFELKQETLCSSF